MSLLTTHRAGFPSGLTAITTLEDPSGIALGVWKPEAAGRQTVERETAWLLLSGSIDFTAGDASVSLTRRSLFDEPPCAFHVSAGTEVSFAPKGACELLVLAAKNA